MSGTPAGHRHHPRPAESGAAHPSRTKSFSRRSRRLHPGLARTLDAHGADYVVDVPRGGGVTTVAPGCRLDARALFGRGAPLTVEIGSGVGEQLVAAARRWPDRDFVGIEVWRPGIAKTVSRAVRAGVANLRLVEADAAQALPILFGPGAVAEVWTFFPDPWRKARHHKRRLVNADFALAVARVLEDGGLWRLATDWEDYAWQIRDVVEACPLLANPYAGERPDPADPEPARGGFAPRFAGRVPTHFEQRGRDAGRRARDVVAVRIPDQPIA